MAPQTPSLLSPSFPERHPRTDPEVVPKARRRQFSVAEKLRILHEANACTQPGQIGALLRREGIYSSHLSTWRRLRTQGQFQALSPQQRGPKPTTTSADDELTALRRENARLQAQLVRAETIIEVQKKSRSCSESRRRRHHPTECG